MGGAERKGCAEPCREHGSACRRGHTLANGEIAGCGGIRDGQPRCQSLTEHEGGRRGYEDLQVHGLQYRGCRTATATGPDAGFRTASTVRALEGRACIR